MNKRYWFFGSKLNSVLLLILIILMIIAIHIMLQNKEYYLEAFQKETPAVTVDQLQTPIPKETLLGNKNDLISFSIWPNTKVHGVVSYRGVIKNSYFFEANIGINILDANKKIIKSSNAVAKTDWATSGPVSFEGNIDFTGLPTGPAYFEIHNDNASGIPANDKSVLVPIIIQ